MKSLSFRALAMAAVGFGVVSGAVLVEAPAASATPTSCAIGAYGADGYYGICRTGTGTYRVVAKCEDPLRGSISTIYGNVVGINVKSYVTCPYSGNVQFVPVSASIQQVS